MKIDPASSNKIISQTVIMLFRKHYKGHIVRQIGVRCDDLVDQSLEVFSLFDDYDQKEKENQLEATIDTIRDQFGVLSLQKASSLLEASRVAERSQLIGGHSASNVKERKKSYD